MTFGRRLITALEILRAHAEAYSDASYSLAMTAQSCSLRSDAMCDESLVAVIADKLEGLSRHCEYLPVTSVKVGRVLAWLRAPKVAREIISGKMVGHHLSAIQEVLVDELSTKLFFHVPHERKQQFEEPLKGWEVIVDKFPESIRDVEEMNKCFALSRYTASIFHALQVAEWGAIYVGQFIGVDDHKLGWGATTKGLGDIIAGGWGKAEQRFKNKFKFLEQINRELNTMVFAWRHKVDHAANRLAIMPNADFTPDVAEHIIQSVKVFMSRLTEEIT
jgi:hypothetical protein